MNTFVRLMLVALLLVVAVPAYSGEAVQMWKCSFEGDTTEEQVEAAASAWLKAAKKLPGGENLKAFVYFPIAVNATGETDFMFMVVAPTFAEWGEFWDHFIKAENEELDSKELFVCPDSVVWEAVKVE